MQAVGLPTSRKRSLPLVLWALLAAVFAILAIQIWRYDFLCDDAFISFRYSRNLAQGYGLVFNPGQERVEGYSNFLWVVILALAQRLGVAPDIAANPLLIFCGFATVFLVLRFCWRELPAAASPYWLLAPGLLLAVNRSFALWCTSGLETKLYELLLVAGVLSTVREMDEMAARRPAFPFSAIWLALAALTRPDGLLYAGCIVLARVIWQLADRTIALRSLLQGAVLFVIPVGGQFVFRRLYYADWLPNTYYAKVGGQVWWKMGFKYLGAFALEYATFLWVPIIFAAIVYMRDQRRLVVGWIIAAAILPHALYVAAIGGDHFEWRVLDAYLPLLAILFFYAGCALARSLAGSLALACYMLIAIAAGTFLPEMSRRHFPSQYRVGFPGLTPRDGYLTEFIDSTQSLWIFQSPLLKDYAIKYNDWMYDLSRQFVGLRQEEHKAFLGTARQEGIWIAELLEKGILPRELFIATDCVGAIPYFSNLRVLDRVGLTDRTVARGKNARKHFRVMAHDKMATEDYIRESGVDIAALDNVHLVLPAGHPRLLLHAHRAIAKPANQVFADLGDGRFLLGTAVQGIESLQRRLPRLKLRSAVELIPGIYGEHGEAFHPVPPATQFGPPYDMLYFDQGLDLIINAYAEGAIVEWQCAIMTNPSNQMAIGNARQLNQWIIDQKAHGQPVNRPPPPGWFPEPGEPSESPAASTP